MVAESQNLSYCPNCIFESIPFVHDVAADCDVAAAVVVVVAAAVAVAWDVDTSVDHCFHHSQPSLPAWQVADHLNLFHQVLNFDLIWPGRNFDL